MRKLKLPYLLMSFVFVLSVALSTYAQTSKINSEQSEEYALKMQDLPYQSSHKPLPLRTDRAPSYFYEDFETWPPTDWTFTNVGAGFISSTTAYSGAQAAFHNDDTGNQADWMISPAVVIPTGIAAASVTWYQMNNYGSYYTLHEVAVSLNADMTDSTIVYAGVALEDDWEQVAADLSAFIGDTVYVGFYYEGNWSDEWWIDDFEVIGPSDDNDITFFEVDNQVGDAEIDVDAHTVMAYVMYDSTLSLIPAIDVSPFATIDTSLTVAEDFTSPVTFTVTAQSGLTQDWVVTLMNVDPADGFEILDIAVDNAVDYRWDEYGHRIEVEVMYDSTLTLEPAFDLSDFATISPSGAQDFSGNLGVTYTVTAQDGGTLDWRVIIENTEPSMEAYIEDVAHDSIVDWDFTSDSTIMIYVTLGTDLTAFQPWFDVSWAATIADTTQAYDFTAGSVDYTVTAQDGVTAMTYTVTADFIDVTAPTVTAAGVSVENYGDSILVSSTEDGYVYLAEATAGWDLTSVWVDAGVDTYIPSDDLEPGKYFAYAEDEWGNTSDMTSDTIFIAEANVEVASLAELWQFNGMENILYTVTGEVVLTYQQDYRNKKWVQDVADSTKVGDLAGIEIDDNAGTITTTYNINDGFSGLTGYLNDYFGQLQFVPSEDPGAATSTDNVVEPILLTMEEFNDTWEAYQSMLVEIDNATFVDGDGTTTFDTGDKLDIFSGESWAIFRTSFYDADYIGDLIPETAQNIVGIKSINWSEPVITAREATDFSEVADPLFFVNTDMLDFGGVLFGESSEMSVHIMNMGGGELVVDRAYVVGGDNAFYFTDAPFINQVVTDEYLNILFAPADLGDFAGTFVIEYNGDMTAEVALTGSAANIPVYGYPYFEDFEAGIGDWINHEYAGTGFIWDEGDDGMEAHHVGYNNPEFGNPTEILFTSPYIDLTGAEFPVLKFDQSMINLYWANTEVWVSTDGENWDNLGFVVTSANYVVEEVTLDLADYLGETIMIGFYLDEEDTGYGTPVQHWSVDNVRVEEGPVNPIYTQSDDMLNFPATDVNSTSEFGFDIWNSGISFFTVTSVAISGTDAAEFALVDDNTYPWEVGVDGYGLYLNKNMVSFAVTFNPTTIGEKSATLTINYTDPRSGDYTVEVPIMANAISCAEATVAVVGENAVPFATNWYEYTPPVDQLVTVSSCLAGQFVDTDVKVLNTCDGIVVAANDDADCEESGFPYSSTVTFAAAAGNTYKIQWLDTWEASGFTFVLSAEDLHVAPTLVGIESQAVDANTANTTLFWDPAPQIDPNTKATVIGSLSETKYKVDEKVFNILRDGSKCDDTLEPVGADEGEPNDGPLSGAPAPVIVPGTEDAPYQITGIYNDPADPWDWWTIELEASSYLHAAIDVTCGDIELWIINADYSGYKSDDNYEGVGEEVHTRLYTPGTYFVLTRHSTGHGQEYVDGGYKYNLEVWFTQPPKFHVYKDDFEIAYDNMAFEYTDASGQVGVNACYRVSQELFDGSESDLSNELCWTPPVGPGQICDLAIEAVDGMNWSEGADYYYFYTATQSGKAKMTSCLEENTDLDPDTRFFIYASCNIPTPGEEGGNEIAFSEDDGCEFTASGYTSTLEWTVTEGVTYIIMFDDLWDTQGFWFDISVEPLLEGQICESAIPLDLPVVGEAGNTAGYGDDYDALDCDANYVTGDDKCYVINVEHAGLISGDITGEYAGLHVFKGLPGDDECVAFAGGPTGGSFADEPIEPGEYFVVVSSYEPTQTTDFVFNLSVAPYDLVDVTFNVDMNVQIWEGEFDPATDSVDMVTNVNMWDYNGNLTDDDGDGIYTGTYSGFYVAEEFKYKYRINSDFATAEFSADIYNARTFAPGLADNVTDDLFNDQPYQVAAVTFFVNMRHAAEIGIFDPTADFVDLAGSFNNWEGSAALEPVSLGSLVYTITVSELVQLSTIEFKFRINGDWATSEFPNGGDNRTYVVKKFDSEYECWYDDNTSTEDLVNNTLFEVYPNPNKGLFNVALSSASAVDYTIELINVQGQTVYSNVLSGVTNMVEKIDISTLAKGVYYLKVNEKVQKVIVE